MESFYKDTKLLNTQQNNSFVIGNFESSKTSKVKSTKKK